MKVKVFKVEYGLFRREHNTWEEVKGIILKATGRKEIL